MKLQRESTYQALADWYVVLGGQPHILRYTWSLTVPLIAHFAYSLDDQQIHSGVQEVITSTLFDRNTDRFEWRGYHFTRKGHELTVNGTPATDTSQLGSLKTVWYIELDGATHIVQFSRVSALITTIGGASVGWPGTLVGKAMDWVVGRIMPPSFPAASVWPDGEQIHKSTGFWHQTLRIRAQRHGHTFSVSWNRRTGPELTVDGEPVGTVYGEEGLAHPLEDRRYQLISDQVVEATSEVLGIEVYRFNNLLGAEAVTTKQEIARTVSNELVLERNLQGAGEASLDLPGLLQFVNADISAKLAVHTGQKIGEAVTRRQTITMGAPPHTQVWYTLTWTRTVRRGVCTVRAGHREVELTYKAYLDLAFDLVAHDPPVASGDEPAR